MKPENKYQWWQLELEGRGDAAQLGQESPAQLEPQPVLGTGGSLCPPEIRNTSAALIARGASPLQEMLLAPEAQTLDQQ